MSNLLHIEDFSQFFLQESSSVASQSNKINFLKLVRTSKERGKVPRDVHSLKSSVCNLGRAPSSTSGNSTIRESCSQNLIRAGKAPQRVKDLGRYFNPPQPHKSSSFSCLKTCGISSGRVSMSSSPNCRNSSFVSANIL